MIFLKCISFFTYSNHHIVSSFSHRKCKEIIKTICKVNSINVNLHSYYNNFANLHIFNLNNVGDFGDWTCKIDTFFYFVLINANALESKKKNQIMAISFSHCSQHSTQVTWPKDNPYNWSQPLLTQPSLKKKKKKKKNLLIRPNCPNPFKLPNPSNWKTKPRPTRSTHSTFIHWFFYCYLHFAMCKRFYGQLGVYYNQLKMIFSLILFSCAPKHALRCKIISQFYLHPKQTHP